MYAGRYRLGEIFERETEGCAHVCREIPVCFIHPDKIFRVRPCMQGDTDTLQHQIEQITGAPMYAGRYR